MVAASDDCRRSLCSATSISICGRRRCLAGEVVINAVAPFGNIDVLVPDGVKVDVGGFTLFGSKNVAVGEATTSESGGSDPGAWFLACSGASRCGARDRGSGFVGAPVEETVGRVMDFGISRWRR